jgi:hypothetical protein
VDGDDVPAAAEEREHGVGGMRRVIAQADVVRGAFEVLPRATRVCEELDCLDALLKIASGMVAWDGEEEMGLEKRKVLAYCCAVLPLYSCVTSAFTTPGARHATASAGR